MTKEEWLSYLKETLQKKTVEYLAQIALKSNSLSDLLDLSLYPESKIAFRATWVLEHALAYSPEGLISIFPDFLQAYLKQNNPGCRRHFTKILMYFSEKQSDILNNYQSEPVIETTFEWLIAPKTPVAVQVNCLTVLFNLRYSYSWVEDELRDQINFLMKDGSAAMQSRGKKLLKKLK